jgi:hypothetical protein
MEVSSRALSAHKRNKSDAVPLHMLRLPIMVRTQVASGSASMMLSTAALRLAGESAGGPERGFARRGPEREIRHARQDNGAHARRVCFDDALDGRSSVGCIGTSESAGGAP